MAQSLSKVLLHIVFSTKNRFSFLIDREIRAQMHAYLGGICRGVDCPALIVGGVADHCHILCRLHRTLSISDFVGNVKRESSKWIKTKGHVLTKFGWQNGYGAFSVGQSEVERVKAYIRDQEIHHKTKTFQDEYRAFLREFEIDYDERYVWD
ncbi:MAG: IS200/IS605 family transposase [Bacteroidota bacterium]